MGNKLSINNGRAKGSYREGGKIRNIFHISPSVQERQPSCMKKVGKLTDANQRISKYYIGRSNSVPQGREKVWPEELGPHHAGPGW